MSRAPSYRLAATLCSALFALLAVILVAAPALIFWLFALEPSDGADLLSRRAAMLFVGLSLVLFWTKDHPISQTRTALSKAIALSMIGLAGLGVFEWAGGNAGPGISLAIATEILVAFALMKAN